MERRLIGSAVLMLLVGCLAGLAFAVPLMQREQVAPVAAQTGTGIAGCASKRTGAVRLLSTPGRRVGNRRPRRCRRNEVAVSWSVAGTQGPQGLQGPQGPPGAPVDPATTILNQSAQAQAASLFVDGQLRTTAGLRLGSETGTSLAPVYPGAGLVVRPIRAGANGQTIALVGTALVRLSSEDNIILSRTDPAAQPVTFSCVHVRVGNVATGVSATLSGSFTGSTLMVDPGGGVIVNSLSMRCAIGSPDGHQADLMLSRADEDSSDWQGFLTTTTNQ